jgi:hypothetical protein
VTKRSEREGSGSDVPVLVLSKCVIIQAPAAEIYCNQAE